MYTIDNPALVKSFIGSRLWQIGILAYQWRFHFNDDLILDLAGQVVVQRPGARVVDRFHPPHFNVALLEFLEKTVTDAVTNPARDELTLIFNDSVNLTFIGSDKQYECFDILLNGERTIV